MTAAHPELLHRSADDSWNRDRWEQIIDDGNRYEVIDGVLYMSKSPSYFHQTIVNQLMRIVGWPAMDGGWGHANTAPVGVFMPGCDPVQPDFVLVRSERFAIIRDGHVNGTPDLIVEVLSPSNSSQDTIIKRRAYARADVPEYWMIRPAQRDVIVCWKPAVNRGDYSREFVVAGDDDPASPTLPVTFSVADLFRGSPDTTL